MGRTGRPAIFRDKQVRVQGLISRVGSSYFEQARTQLAALVGWKVSEVSDADTVEFLARGPENSRTYLKL